MSSRKQEGSAKEASQKESDIFFRKYWFYQAAGRKHHRRRVIYFLGNIDFTKRECSRQSLGNDDKQSWNIGFSAEKSKTNSSKRVKLFSELCQEGPTIICVICIRCLYGKSVKTFGQTESVSDVEDITK